MRVWTRTQPWCRSLVLSQFRVLQRAGSCGGGVETRHLNSAVREYHTRSDCVIQSKRGTQRQDIADCRLSHRRLISVFPSCQLRHCSSVHMASLTTPGTPDEYRLPTNVKPAHYDVTIKTDLENQTFEGFVRIECVFFLSNSQFRVIIVMTVWTSKNQQVGSSSTPQIWISDKRTS